MVNPAKIPSLVYKPRLDQLDTMPNDNNPSYIQNDGCWKDITTEFRDSVKQLNLGELQKMEQFTLFEAMSAIELMDPRVDSGLFLKKSSRQILNLEQSVRAGFVKINNLELEELIGIIDDSYACLVAWLEGNSLSQTVMTNLYLRDTERIEDKCLRTFSQSMLKIVDSMDMLVHYVYCIEEEDFQLNSGRFSLAIPISAQKISNALEDVCQQYEKQLLEVRNATTINGQSVNNDKLEIVQHDEKKSFADELKLSSDKDKSQLLIAIIQRLRFTHNFLSFFLNVSKNLLKDHNITGPNSVVLYQKTIKLVQTSANLSDQYLETCLKCLNKWKGTIDLGIKPIVTREYASSEVDYPTIMGFNPLINHKLLPPAYPRCPSIKSRSTTVDSLEELVLKLKECTSLVNIFYQKSFNKSIESIEHFSKYFRPQSCVISRSYMLALYLQDRVIYMLKEELLQSIGEYCEPLKQLMKKDSVMNQALDEFLEEGAKTFSHAIIMYGYNSARQHERFPDLILSFKNLQYTAFLLKDVFKNTIIYSWTTYHFAKFCIRYVLAGLELELFSSHEYPYVFWYLYDILYRNEKEQIEFAKQHFLEVQLAIDENNTKKAKSGKKPRKKPQYNTSFHDKNILLNNAYRFLTGGMFLITYGLKVQGKIKSPSLEFTSEEVCFDHRFGSITGTSVFNAYKTTLGRLDKLEYIYREAFDCFSEARSLFDKHGEFENCSTLCKTNMVVAKILSSNPNSFADREVEFCFDRHASFPTIKL